MFKKTDDLVREGVPKCNCHGTLGSRCSSVPTSTLSFEGGCGAVGCSVVQCGAMLCSVVQCGAMLFTVVQCCAMLCSEVQCGAMLCTVVQCGARLSTYLLHPVLAEKIAQGSFGVENPNIL